MHPKDAESIKAFATETGAAILRIVEAHNKLYDRVEALEKKHATVITPAEPSELDRLRARVKELEEAAKRLQQQADLCNFTDEHGHDLRMNAAYLDIIAKAIQP